MEHQKMWFIYQYLSGSDFMVKLLEKYGFITMMFGSAFGFITLCSGFITLCSGFITIYGGFITVCSGFITAYSGFITVHCKKKSCSFTTQGDGKSAAITLWCEFTYDAKFIVLLFYRKMM